MSMRASRRMPTSVAANQSINYYLPPLGHYLELISYPNGMAYEATAPIPLWSPRKPGG